MDKLKAVFITVAFILILSLGIWRGVEWMANPVSVDSTEQQEFVVAKGDPIALVARKLKEANLIRAPFAFRMLVTTRNINIQAGQYNLSPSMSTYEIAQTLTHGTFDYKITIIEGLRVEEIAEQLNSEIGLPIEEFLEDAEEGYVFPETYFVPAEISAQGFASLMRATFDEKVNAEIKDDIAAQGLSLDEVVTLASIVEREANTAEARPIVAGILLKRWKNDWPLEADATVQYALASRYKESGAVEFSWWPKNLTAADLEIDSLYNTRKYKGLPPTPICNPGIDSLKATVYPTQTDYWFYITDTEGEMRYSRTMDQHNQNVLKYLR